MCNAAESHAFLHQHADTLAMYGEPFIDLATGQRLRISTDAHGGQRPFLTRIRAMWRAAALLAPPRRLAPGARSCEELLQAGRARQYRSPGRQKERIGVRARWAPPTLAAPS